MAKKKRRNHSPNTTEKQEKKPIDKRALCRNVLRLLVLVAVTLAVYIVYKVLIDRFFYPVVITYMTLTAVSVFAYVIYNRGFSRKGITPDMLPDSISDEEKESFIEDGKRRIKKSRPLFIVAFAFVFTLLMDLIELVTFPFLKGIFGLWALTE